MSARGNPLAIVILAMFLIPSLCALLSYAEEEPAKACACVEFVSQGFAQTDDAVKRIESVLEPEKWY